MSSPEVDTMFEQLLQDLPAEVEQQARQFQAFARARKIRTPRQLLRVVLLYCGLDKCLREAAGHFPLLYESITDQSVAERLAACRPWVQALLPQLLGPRQLSGLEKVGRFLVIDGTQVQGPGAKGSQYRLHVALDLVSLEFVQIRVTDKRTGESLANFLLGPGDSALADRGYAHPDRIVAAVLKRADLILRLNAHNVPVYGLDGQRLDLAKQLKHQPVETIQTRAAEVRSADGQHSVAGWLHAYRLNREQAQQARRRARRNNRKKRRTPKAETLFLAGWVLVWTSLPPEQLSAEQVLDLYRLRWQVEVAIKRWKSLLDVGQLRAHEGSPLAELWLHGKLLYALMLEKRMRRKLGDRWGRLDQQRTATWWRPWKLLQDEIAPLIAPTLFWSEPAWPSCLKVIAERPRKRKLKQVPHEALQLLATLPRLRAWSRKKAA
jgi:Transposase DDE domain